MSWPLGKAVTLAPVIVCGGAALVALVLLWGKVALTQLRESRNPLRLVANRGRDGEPGGGVAGSLHLDPLLERRPLGVAPADDRRVDSLLVLRADVEEPGAFWRHEPLVCVARVEVGAKRIDVDRHV